MEGIDRGSVQDYDSRDRKTQWARTGEAFSGRGARESRAVSSRWNGIWSCSILTSYSVNCGFLSTKPDVTVEGATKTVLVFFFSFCQVWSIVFVYCVFYNEILMQLNLSWLGLSWIQTVYSCIFLFSKGNWWKKCVLSLLVYYQNKKTCCFYVSQLKLQVPSDLLRNSVIRKQDISAAQYIDVFSFNSVHNFIVCAFKKKQLN